MPSALNIIGQSQPPGAEQILYAEVASPVPTGFNDPLYVIFPDWSNQYSFKVKWDVTIHGSALPALGAQALVIKENRGLFRCVWWDGQYKIPSANPIGAAGGVLSGEYPNPGMAAGAASMNVGSLGGVLSGTLPNPGFAVSTGVVFRTYLSAAAQVGSLASAAKIALNTTDYDSGTYWDNTNHRYTPQIAGYYFFTGTIGGFTGALADGDLLETLIYKNGSVLATAPAGMGAVESGNANFGITCNISATVHLNGSTDYVELWGLCITSAGAQVTTTALASLEAFMIR